MAQYKKEIAKWITILLDKIILDQAFKHQRSGLLAQDAYIFARFQGPMSIDEFYRSVSLERKMAQRLLRQLLERKYLRKENDPDDARKKQLVLTDLGWEIQLEIITYIDYHLDLILKDMTVNEERAVLKFVSKVNQFTVDKHQIK